MNKYTFYGNCLQDWISDRAASVLVVGSGMMDRRVFAKAGFRNVTVTDLSDRGEVPTIEGLDEAAAELNRGYRWERENVNSLSYTDAAFDWVVVHAALHHCSQPHQAMLEMYRVARRGILVIESRDSLTVRLAQRLGLTMSYEVTVVRDQNRTGGVDNTEVPNYIYRWTEREIVKTISSNAPYAPHRYHFKYANSVGAINSLIRQGGIKRVAGRLAQAGFMVFSWLFPKQQNLFAFAVEKPRLPNDLFPWLEVRNDQVSLRDDDSRDRPNASPQLK